MLIADVYGLDPSHYFSSSGLSWDAMLKITGFELELISNTYNISLLKKEWEVVFLTLLKDIVKQMTNTWNNMILIKQACIFHI